MKNDLITRVQFIIPTNITYNTVISMGELDELMSDTTHKNEMAVAREMEYEDYLLEILPQTDLYEYSVISEIKDITYRTEKFLAKLLQVTVNYDINIHIEVRLLTNVLKHKNSNYMKLKYPDFYKCWKHIHIENMGTVRTMASVFSESETDLFNFIFDDL